MGKKLILKKEISGRELFDAIRDYAIRKHGGNDRLRNHLATNSEIITRIEMKGKGLQVPVGDMVAIVEFHDPNTGGK